MGHAAAGCGLPKRSGEFFEIALDILVLFGTVSLGRTGPIFETQENDIKSALIGGKETGRVEQLLKGLIIGRKFDRRRNAELLKPKVQWLCQTLGCECPRYGNGLS